ncbi:MAG: response regulator [Burkholderiaceae bacterium]|nr:response regulator [Burkholderiaceae bacterium]
MNTGAPLRVLYAEDDRISAVLMAQILAIETGIDLRLAEDGAEALAALADDWLPDLLILDAHLPDTTGHALLARLRAQPGLQRVPACMCSADGLAEDRQRAAEAGFDDYWTKPVSVPAVLECLRSLKAARR